MELLHTQEEIIRLDKKHKLADKLQELANQYNEPRLKEMSIELHKDYDLELAKYYSLIGTKAYAPPPTFGASKEYREGTIEKFTHFNAFSKSVRCTFRYKDGGFDGHALRELRKVKPI